MKGLIVTFLLSKMYLTTGHIESRNELNVETFRLPCPKKIRL